MRWPSTWSDNFPICGNKRQSPINIASSEASVQLSLEDITMTGYDKPIAMSIRNNGHTAQVDITSGDAFIENGGLPGKYKLLQLHFHWGSNNDKGSEHTINGEQFPMEMHLVHYLTSAGDVGQSVTLSEGLAVIGFMFEISDDDNEKYTNIISKLTTITEYSSGSSVSVQLPEFAVGDLLPNNPRHFYRYFGSLTTPGCDEIVVWSVFKEKIKISKRQLGEFRKLMSSEGGNLQNNFRPVQPLHDRVVRANFNVADTDDSASEEK
ncbi:carbonic anhydrase 4-like [Patella vulgata]|uniref:carbonic anhydrase 4-like n=1 Tax=Patella vulgata TaxID=6465 RepID=UPI0024A93BF8|nr:carbonic anhydrase 4-like [Patella vulgata]